MTTTNWNASDKNSRLSIVDADSLVIQRSNDFSQGSHWATIRATNPKTTGKWMFATRPLYVRGGGGADNRYHQLTGFADVNQSIANNNYLGQGAGGISSYPYTQKLLGNGIEQASVDVWNRGFGWTLHAIDIDAKLYWQALLPAVGTCWDWIEDRKSIQPTFASANTERLFVEQPGFATGTWRAVRSSSKRFSGNGKVTFQVRVDSTTVNFCVGVAPVATVANDSEMLGASAGNGIGYRGSNGIVSAGGGTIVTLPTAANGDIITVVFDTDTGDIWFNNDQDTVWNANGSASPVSGTGGINFTTNSAGSGPYEAVLTINDIGRLTASFGPTDLGTAIPSGGGVQWWDDYLIQPLDWSNNGDPGAGTGGVDVSYIVGTNIYCAASLLDGLDEILANFGAEDFPLPVGYFPSGFDTWDESSNPTGRVTDLVRETLYTPDKSELRGQLTGLARETLFSGINRLRMSGLVRETLYIGHPRENVNTDFAVGSAAAGLPFEVRSPMSFLPGTATEGLNFTILAIGGGTEIPVRDPKEWIPYRPTLPRLPQVDGAQPSTFGSPEADMHIRELQAQLREEHVRLHTGGTDQPWEYLEILDDEPRYTPGSRGRFRHPDFGILHARYCHFFEMNGTALGGPVGYYYTPDEFEWQATNDITKSSAVRGFGLLCQPEIPANGKYGWVLVEGTNLYSLRIKPEEVIAADQELAWSGDGEVSALTLGGSVGRHVNPETRDYISGYGIGEIVLFQGSGSTAFNSVLDAGLNALQAVFESQLETLEAALSGALGNRIEAVEAAQATQVSINGQFDTRIYNLQQTIAGVNLAITDLSTQLVANGIADSADAAALAALRAEYDAFVLVTNAAIAGIASIPDPTATLTSLAGSIAALQTQVEGLNQRTLRMLLQQPENIIEPDATELLISGATVYDSGEIDLIDIGIFPDDDGGYSETLSFGMDLASVDALDTMYGRLTFLDGASAVVSFVDTPWINSTDWTSVGYENIQIPDGAEKMQLTVINHGEEDSSEVATINDDGKARKIRMNLGGWLAPFIVPIRPGGGGGGATDFTDLGDVPASYTGNALKYVRVNAGETALEFQPFPTIPADLVALGDVDITPGSGIDGYEVYYDHTSGLFKVRRPHLTLLLPEVVTTGSQTTVTFSGFSAAYKHLELRGFCASTNTATTTSDALNVRFNSDTGSNYRYTYDASYASGTRFGGGSTSTTSIMLGLIGSYGGGAPMGSVVAQINDYNNAADKKWVLNQLGVVQVNVGSIQSTGAGWWNNNAAITSITLLLSANAFQDGSKFWLYGRL